MECTIIAHRCGPGKYPEQSIASARNALSDGADFVEMDVRFTADSVPVICHDANVERMFGENTLVSDMSFEHFMSLRHKRNVSYPSHALEDMFSADVKPMLLHCKLSDGLLAKLVDSICLHGYEKDVVIGVLDASDVRIIKSGCAKIRVLSFMPRLDMLESFLKSDADIIRLWEAWVSIERINAIHAAGKLVWVMAGSNTEEGVGYTDDENLKRWVDMGVDGILVNDVPRARRVLGGREICR